MRSAEPMPIRQGRPPDAAEAEDPRVLEVAGPTMDRTRMLSESPGTPGRRQHRPRTTRSIEAPAREAR